MNCAFDKEKLTGYYDGELGAAEKAEVERHIASCSECLRDLGELKSAALLVRDLPRLRAPKSIAEGVRHEVQAAGKVHVFSKVRRTVLWASAVAAGLFVVMNVMYFSAQKSPGPSGDMAPMARSVAKADPMAPSGAPAGESREDRGGAGMDKLRETDREKNVGRRAMEPALPAPARQEKNEELAKSTEEQRKLKDETGDHKKLALASAKEAGDAKPGAAPATPPGAPPPAPKTAPVPVEAPPPPAVAAKAPADMAAKAKPVAKPEPFAEKAAMKRELDATPRAESELKAKVAAAGAPAELPPALLNIVSTQVAKARTRLDDSLKAMGVSVVPPAPQPVKAPRNREAENTVVVELTDSQMARLREDLEKPGDTRLVVTSPVDPVLPAFHSGGIFGKKDVAAQAGGAKPAPTAKDKDAKEAENAATAGGKGADLSNPPEQRRKVTLHLVEAKSLPAADADDRTKK